MLTVSSYAFRRMLGGYKLLNMRDGVLSCSLQSAAQKLHLETEVDECVTQTTMFHIPPIFLLAVDCR